MGNYTFTAPTRGTTAAVYIAWISSIEAGLVAAGLVKVTDTGQAILSGGSAVSLPTAQRDDYVIYRFNDSVQSTSPVFLKFLFGGILSFGQTYFDLEVDIGTGWVDGGTITNTGASVLTFSVVPQNLGSNGGVTGTGYISGDGSGLAMILGITGGSSVYESWFVFDRHRSTSNGIALATGAMAFQGQQQVSTVTQGHWSFGAGADNTATQLSATVVPCITDGTLSSTLTKTNTGGQTQLYPWWSTTWSSRGPSKMLVTYNEADLGTLNPGGYACTFLGTNSHYLTFGNRLTGTFTCNAEAGAAPAIWWSSP